MITLKERAVTQSPCDCCGNTTFRVTGDLHDDRGWLAFYSVRHTPTHPDQPSAFTLGYGDWTEAAPTTARWIFGAVWSLPHQAFMLSDLADQPPQGEATHLNRSDILGTSFAEDAFAMLDAVLLNDTRLTEMRP